MLNLFLQSKKDAEAKPVERRPHVATEVTDLASCEHWRRQVIRDIARDIAAIQDAGLGEHRIRDLNDGLNKLLREKKHWEKQIKALGGQDYEATAPRILDQDGKRALGSEGYLYFGAAKELPGVRELFERRAHEPAKQTRAELHKLVDAEYYGFKDEDDGKLVRLEAVAERAARAANMDVSPAVDMARRAQREAAAEATASRMGDDDAGGVS